MLGNSADSLLVGIERAQPTPSPARHEIGRSGSIVGSVPELISDPQQRPEHCRTIVVDQFDKPRLLNEATQFDQMPSTATSILHPIALVITGLRAVESVPQHGQMSELGFNRP